MAKPNDDDVVPVGEGIGLDDDGIPDDPFRGESSAVYLGGNRLDNRASATVKRRFRAGFAQACLLEDGISPGIVRWSADPWWIPEVHELT